MSISYSSSSSNKSSFSGLKGMSKSVEWSHAMLITVCGRVEGVSRMTTGNSEFVGFADTGIISSSFTEVELNWGTTWSSGVGKSIFWVSIEGWGSFLITGDESTSLLGSIDFKDAFISVKPQ